MDKKSEYLEKTGLLNGGFKHINDTYNLFIERNPEFKTLKPNSSIKDILRLSSTYAKCFIDYIDINNSNISIKPQHYSVKLVGYTQSRREIPDNFVMISTTSFSNLMKVYFRDINLSEDKKMFIWSQYIYRSIESPSVKSYKKGLKRFLTDVLDSEKNMICEYILSDIIKELNHFYYKFDFSDINKNDLVTYNIIQKI